MDKFKKRELFLFNKAINTARAFAGISTEAPSNYQIVYRLACLQWEFAQEYRSESSSYYVSKASYTAAQKRIDTLEAGITEGVYKAQAVQAAADAREYLSLIAEYRIRNNKKCRVF